MRVESDETNAYFEMKRYCGEEGAAQSTWDEVGCLRCGVTQLMSGARRVRCR